MGRPGREEQSHSPLSPSLPPPQPGSPQPAPPSRPQPRQSSRPLVPSSPGSPLPSIMLHPPHPRSPQQPPTLCDPSLTTPQGGLGRPGREEQSLLRNQPRCTSNPGVAAIRTARPAKAGRKAAGGSGRARRQGRGLPCPLARFRVCLAVTAAEARLAADRSGSAAPRG